MPSREECGIRNLTLEEQNAKEMMFRFRVRINQRKKSNLSRTFRGPYKARRLVLENRQYRSFEAESLSFER